MDGKIVMISYETMMDDYVPAPTLEKNVHEPTDRQLASMFKFGEVFEPEVNMCDSFTYAINNGWLKDSSYKVVATASVDDQTDKSKQRVPVDCAMYHEDAAPAPHERANWSAVELSIEYEVELMSDEPFPFDEDEDEEKYQPKLLERREDLEQIASYVALIFAKQHRTHHFTLVVLGKMARIVRWDRAGAIVTEKFDYMAEPAKLGRFLWRLAHMTDVQRGHDPTATRLLTSSEEYKTMTKRADTERKLKSGQIVGEHERLLFQDSLKSNAPRWKLSSGSGKGFLVGAPHTIATGLTGRGTRGYVAIDLDDVDGPLVYMKDCWRVGRDRIEQEGCILESLQGCFGIPTLLCHGDVEEQETASQALWKKLHPGEEDKCPLKTHRHYRLVVKEVGLPMSEFENGAELVYLLAQCILAHLEAYNRGVMHRDISDGNVLIYVREVVNEDGSVTVTRDGLLTDWELSKRIDNEDASRQHERTGTWQFMPARVLKSPHKAIDRIEEMESMFHLLLWFAIRFLPHNYKDVGNFVLKYFDDYETIDGEYYCGGTKEMAMKTGQINHGGRGDLTFFCTQPVKAAFSNGRGTVKGSEAIPVHPIDGLIKEILALLHSLYVLTDERVEHGAAAKSSCPRVLTAIGLRAKALLDKLHGNSVPPLEESAEPPLTPEQRAEHEENVRKLGDQKFMATLFLDYVSDENLPWPTNDKLPDQLPRDYWVQSEY